MGAPTDRALASPANHTFEDSLLSRRHFDVRFFTLHGLDDFVPPAELPGPFQQLVDQQFSQALSHLRHADVKNRHQAYSRVVRMALWSETSGSGRKLVLLGPGARLPVLRVTKIRP
jgi:hypothetical protein